MATPQTVPVVERSREYPTGFRSVPVRGWSKANTAAALTGIIAGASTRLIMFALTPQVYGSDNTILYIPNSAIFGNLVDGISAFDGLPTLISPVICLASYLSVAYATQRSSAPVAVTAPAVESAD